MSREIPEIAGASVLELSDPSGHCNLTVRVGDGENAKVLKIFRRRRSALREVLGEACARILHRKRGVDVASRYRSELRSVEVWKSHGFDVLKRFDDPIPGGAGPYAIWYEYVPGRLFSEFLADEQIEWPEKAKLLKRHAATMSHRHGTAIERREPLLVHEFGRVKHVLLHNDRMIMFDFEQVFGPRFNIWEAMTDEVAALLRSLAKVMGQRFRDAVEAVAEGYVAKDRLIRLARRGVSGWSPRRLAKRWISAFRVSDRAKIQALRRLLDVLESRPR